MGAEMWEWRWVWVWEWGLGWVWEWVLGCGSGSRYGALPNLLWALGLRSFGMVLPGKSGEEKGEGGRRFAVCVGTVGVGRLAEPVGRAYRPSLKAHRRLAEPRLSDEDQPPFSAWTFLIPSVSGSRDFSQVETRP